jgi:asparagine synthase (glutamine-hydrolysing)
MCGIFGAVNLKGSFSNNDFDKFVFLTDMVAYRGPNASGYIAINLKEKSENKDKFEIFLGHRRLSIIDLSENANQPLSDGEGLCIIYNGEIFNYLELKQELKQEGFIFKTNSDTEVILKIYKKYGENGFSKLNGMWAFAILDIPNRKIILSRDRFSIKPLYYIQDRGRFYFASEIKQLLPLLPKKELNHTVMFKYIEQGLVDYDDESFFKNVYKVKPKHNFVIYLDTGEIKISKYWDYQMEEMPNLTLNEAAENFRQLFIDSVKIRLRSDVKVGALLSGGLDSSSISIIANKLQDKFCTYSVISKEKKYSEERYIDIITQKAKIENHKILFKFNDEKIFLKYIDKVIYHNDEPFCGFSAVAQYMVLETLRKNSDIVVVLSGQGGDEILMGYLKYFFFNIRNLIKTSAFKEALTQLMNSFIKRTMVWQFKLSEARRYLPFLIRKTPKSFLKINDTLEPIWEANNLKERQILDIDKYSVPALTHYEDRNSMAHSLEIRLPFLDHRLVNYVLNLPIAFKLNSGWSKYILRKAIYELPHQIRWRRDKQGFIIPEKLWLMKEFSSLINKIFTKSILEEMGIIDSKLFLEYYHKFQRGKKDIWYTDISRALIAEMWTRKFFMN